MPQIDWENLTKTLVHRTKIRILTHMMTAGECSPIEISKALDEPLGNVSYHVRHLLAAGLIQLTRTEPRRGAVEHYYVLQNGVTVEDKEEAAT